MEAKSDLADVSTYDVLKGDFKHYEINGKKVGFGVAETLLPQQLLDRKDDLLAEMEGEKAKQGLDFIFFAIVDTKTKNSHLVIYSGAEAELAGLAYGEAVENDLMYLPGMMSRKSQLMPAVQATLSA